MTSLLHVFGDTFPAFGFSLLLAAMVVASYTFAVSLAAGANGRPRTLQAARFGAYGTVALIGTAVVCLAYAFVTHDFRIRYVAHYSDRSMPLHYLFTALWGGQDGSLLWWLFLLSAYIGVCVKWLGKRYLELQPFIIATLMAIVLFFCILMAFAANPFATNVAGMRADGDGLNPALQNYWMVIHPPCLYTGFVGCSVPFAFGVAALVTGRLDHEWIVASRKWTLFAWMFLGIGNTLGMLWAYESLGWGGYWGWDPVENAAFMPFLTASAYVHSVMIQERRGMLKLWNVFLVGLTFFLTIFGTFLTRSGMIASVHAFAQSSIGTYFAVFLVMLVVFATTLVLYRWPELRDLPASPKLRAAAVAAGWLIIAVCGPGLYIVWHLGLPVTLRVTLIAAIAGAAVFVALEVVFRRMTQGLALATRRPRIESLLSREFTFILNNWILCSLLFFILVATTFPLISDALTGEKVTVGPPFYKAWVQPLGLTLLVLMGLGTLLGWKKTSPEALRRAFRVPVGAGIAAAILHFAFGRMLGFPAVVWADPIYEGVMGGGLRVFNAFTPVAGFSLCVFNAAVIVQEFVWLVRARARAGSDRTPAILWWLGIVPGLVYTLASLSPPSRRRYGGYVVHFGIVLMFLGFTGQSWNADHEASIFPGQTYAAEAYTISYTGARMEVDSSKRMVFADVDVYKNGKLLTHLTPAKFIYKKQPDSPATEVAIHHGLRDDFYLIVGTINPSNKNLAAFQFHINPLVSWIWIGCVILILGSVVCMWPQFELGESRIWAGARGVAAISASIIFGIMLAATPAAQAQTMPGSENSGTVHIESDAERGIFGSLRCMCGTCARDLLSTCTCSTAAEARDRIREKMRAGEARDRIIAEYAADYGPEALAVPPNTGVFRAIWVVPVAGIGLGAFGLARLMKKWRAGPAPAAKANARDGADPYDARLDDELKDLDD
ncbi:MAG TPA: cytochrome c-type biogenesis CcmF C-terminal domain-containing protein [Polyangiaceae bacterium]|jgi:cytochrome c-type biogenesis protein CcmF|nr:cytochrome c-type biogenesis CcmF C-terminal domain-containing protein [Polyangiaceae bacterium]